MASFESNVLSVWPAGTKLGVFPRVADRFSGAHDQIKSTTVKDDGSVKVTGLESDWPYWLAGEDQNGVTRAIAITGKDSGPRPQSPLAQAAAKFGVQSAAPGRATTPNTITGARKSTDIKARHQPVLLDEERKVLDDEPQPHVNQLDAKGPQRSDTPFGQATPKDPKEDVPYPSQDDAKGPQRSDTEFGAATPKNKDEVQPFLSQEDVPKGVKQRSDTELGQAEPKMVQSKGKAAGREAERDRDSSDAKAEGSTEQQRSEQVSKKALRDQK